MTTWLHDFGKFHMVLDKEDMDFSRQVKHFGQYATEKLETSVLERFLKSGMTVVDIGANIGFYTLLARSIVGTNGKVFSFEPDPKNVSFIKKSIKENSYTNITVVDAAISDHVGQATLYLSPFYSSEHSLFDYHYSSGEHKNPERIDVNLFTLDHYFEKNVSDFQVDLIKMDVEGSERRVIRGMKKILDKNQNLVLVTEFWPRALEHAKENPKEFLETLQNIGFNLYHIDELEEKIYPVTLEKMVDITNYRVQKNIERNKATQCGGWYTNLLCVK